MADQTIGSACTTGAGSALASYGGNNSWCNGTTWQFPAYQFGSSALSCASSQAGTIQWTGSAFQGCNGTSWGPIDISTSAALSSLLAATTTNSIDSGSWAQTWKWGTLTTQTALTLSTSSMTSGTLLNLADSSSSTSTGTVLNVSDAETGTTYGLYSSLNGASNTGYAGYFSNSSAVGWALAATGTSYFNGAVGIGTISPNTALEIYQSASGALGPVLTLNNPAGGGGSSSINFRNWSGESQPVVDQIQSVDDLNNSGNILFSTKAQTSGGALSEKMRITSIGSVGIGTTNPGAALAVYTGLGAAYSSGISITNSPNGGYTDFKIYDNWNDGSGGNVVDISNASGEALFIDNGRHVGVGTTSPSDKLDVAGAIGLTTTTATMPTNGIYSSATNSLSLTASGIQALTVSTTGYLGIGTTSPAAKLDVNGFIAADGSSTITSDPPSVGSNNGWKIGLYQSSYAIGSASYTTALKTNGWVSIFSGDPANNATCCTGTPDTGASVSLGNGNTGYNIYTSTANPYYGVYSKISSTTTGTGVYGAMTGHGNTGYAGYFTNTDTSAVNYGLYASTSSSTGYAGYFQGPVNVAGTIGLTATTGTLPTNGVYSPAAGQLALTTSGNAALTVTSTQSVGIGTAAPAAKLHVAGGAVVGNDAAGCTSTNAGEIIWTGIAFEGCNGSSWQILSSVTAAYDLAVFMPNAPPANMIVRAVAERNGTFPAGLTGSGCVAKSGATSSAAITVNQVHSGTTTAVATITFAASGGSNQTCTFTAASTITVVPGDVIEFVFPSTPDATLANIAITLAGSHT